MGFNCPGWLGLLPTEAPVAWTVACGRNRSVCQGRAGKVARADGASPRRLQGQERSRNAAAGVPDSGGERTEHHGRVHHAIGRHVNAVAPVVGLPPSPVVAVPEIGRPIELLDAYASNGAGVGSGVEVAFIGLVDVWAFAAVGDRGVEVAEAVGGRRPVGLTRQVGLAVKVIRRVKVGAGDHGQSGRGISASRDPRPA